MNIFEYLAASLGLILPRGGLATLMGILNAAEPSDSSLVGIGTVGMMIVGAEEIV